MSILINSGVDDDSLPATMDTWCNQGQPRSATSKKSLIRTKASYFDTVCARDPFNLRDR